VINYFGGLTLDDTGLYTATILGANRVANGINMQGGTLTYLGAQSAASVGTVTLLGGAGLGGSNTITVTPATGTVLPSTLTIASLVRATAGTTLNFTGNNPGLGGTNNSQIILTAAPTLDDGIIGGWATVNGTDFASYIAPSGVAGGVGALGMTGYPAYSTNNFTNGVAANNIRVFATATSAASPTFNSLNVAAAAATTLTVSGTLTLATGGLLMNNGANAATITGGTALTSGGAELFVYTNTGAGVNTIATPITGAGVTLVKSGPGNLTLSSTSNTYGGGTVVDAGTLNLSGAGTIIPAANGLTINNATVAAAAANQIAAATNITLNGGSSLTYTGTNSVSGNITFNNTGGLNVANPIITGGTITFTGGSITSVNDSLSSTPTIASIIDLGAAARTINVSGLSANGLILSGVNIGAGGSYNKTGTGSLILTAASTFTGTSTLAAGSIIFGVDSTPSALGSTVTAGPIGTGTLNITGNDTRLVASVATRTLANAITVSNPSNTLNFGVTQFGLTLNGAVTFATATPTITVENAFQANTDRKSVV
jgi:autotransporter-associated beta strand protein